MDPLGRLRNVGRLVHKVAVRTLLDMLPQDWEHRDLAASIQRHLEEVAVRYVQYWMRASGMRNVCLSGVCLLNVRLNQRVAELDEVDGVFVFLAMGDGGLAAGAAFDAWKAQVGEGASSQSMVPHVFLGPAFTDSEIEAELVRQGVEYRRCDDIEDVIARLIQQRKVVARFEGPMEYGPRALGRRTIMYHAGDRSVNDWLNKRLNRTEFMPFAPACLAGHEQQLFVWNDASERAARFMTITLDCTEWMKETCPAVVHVDGTARPQIVDKETSPSVHRVLGVNFEVQHCELRDIAFLRGAIAQAFAGSAVQLRGNAIAGALHEVGHAGALRQVLPEQAVGILVGPPFPGVVGRCEVEARGDPALEGGVAVELRAVIHGEGPYRSGLGADQLVGAAVHVRPGAPRQLADRDEAGLAFDHRQHAGAGLAGAQHRIPLPVPKARAVFRPRRPGGDRPLPRQPAAAVVRPVALATLLARAPEVAVELPARALVRPEVPVDGLMTDRERALPLEPARDLLGAPVLAQEPLDPLPVRRGKPAIAPGARPPPPGVPVRELRAIGAVAAAAVALDLPPDGAAMAAEDARDRRGGEALLAKQRKGVSFGKGDLAIAHGRRPSLGGDRKHTLSQVTFFVERRVALSL
jgi:Carbamoyltransferase C-terminus/Carbamoyltransferase N-terminus